MLGVRFMAFDCKGETEHLGGLQQASGILVPVCNDPKNPNLQALFYSRKE